MLCVKVIGIGCGGLDQVTIEAVQALRSLDHLLITDKRSGNDPLVGRRLQLVRRHVPAPPPVITVADPPRDRGDAVRTQQGYHGAVADWHAARAAAYADALRPLGEATVGLPVWGDPAFYDSALRIMSRVEKLGVPMRVEVIPGISALQMLASRHRLVLNEIGGAVTLTTGRRLAEQVSRGADNLVVMVNRRIDAVDLPGHWDVWWAGNLGDAHESLISGPLAEVAGRIDAERSRLRATCGWVMDVYLLRRSAPAHAE